MGALEVVETLPDCEPAVQLLEPRDHDSFELPVELLVVDSVRPFGLPVEVGTPRPDVPMLNALIEHVPVELRPKLAAIVGLYTVHPEGELGEHLVHKRDCGKLRVALKDFEHPNPCTVINGRVLVVAAALRALSHGSGCTSGNSASG